MAVNSYINAEIDKTGEHNRAQKHTPVYVKLGRGYDRPVSLISEESNDFNNWCCDNWLSVEKKQNKIVECR